VDFSVQQVDRETSARLGRLSTTHGEVDTPAFMPVGTLGPVKGIDPVDLEQLGFRLMLNNAY
jgi:queuine tRNA-ribosyltransferase